MERIKTLWRWISNISTVQFVWSLLGGAVMGVLTWLKDQPVWFVAFVALASFALISFIWAQVVIARRDSGRGSETKAPANKLPKMRATEMAADEVNRAVRSAEPAQSPNPMADVFALPFKHMIEQTAAQLEAQHANKLGKIRNEKPESQRDVILPEALAYAEFGEWGRSFFEAASSAQNHANEQLEKFRQLAHDGALAVWGKRTESGVFQLMPKEHWLDHNVEWFDLLRGRARTENVMNTAALPYSELMVCKADFEREWPVAHDSSEGRVKRRSLIDECRDLAHRYTLDDGGHGFRAFLEGERAYPDIRGHLSPNYLGKLNAQRTLYASADGARYPTLVEWFLDELDRLEKEWGLT